MSITKKKIAIADDDPGVQDIFKIIFEKAGYEILNYGSGKDIYQNKELPSLYILDKQLSGMNGLDICIYLKGDHKTMNIPVIMVSATPGLEKLAKQAGADDFLEKPFRKKELLDMVGKYIVC
jgi:DNA-binding response OmpR family regulator